MDIVSNDVVNDYDYFSHIDLFIISMPSSLITFAIPHPGCLHSHHAFIHPCHGSSKLSSTLCRRHFRRRPRKGTLTINTTPSSSSEKEAPLIPPSPNLTQPSTPLGAIFPWISSHIPTPLRPSRFDREIITLALPAIGSIMIDPLLTFVDTLYISRLGKLFVGAMQPCSNLYNFIFSIAGFVVKIASNVMVTQADAVGDSDGVTSAAIVMVSVALVIAISIVVPAFATPHRLLRLMGARGNMLSTAITYFTARAYAIPASMLVFAFDGILIGLKDTRTPLLIASAVGLINLVLDPLLMFGPLRMGMAGAAYATAIAQWVGLIFFALAFWRKRHCFGRATLARIKSDFARFWYTGASVFVRQMANTGCWTTMGSLATRLGVISAATHQFVLSIYLIICFGIDAIGIGPMVMVPRAKAASGIKIAREIAERALALGAQTATVVAFIVILFLSGNLSLFITDPTVAALAQKVLIVSSATLPPCAVVWIWDAIMFSVGDFAYNAKTLLIASSLGILAMLAAYRMNSNLAGIWLVMMVVFFGIRTFHHARRFYQSPSSPLYLAPDAVPLTSSSNNSSLLITSTPACDSISSAELDYRKEE